MHSQRTLCANNDNTVPTPPNSLGADGIFVVFDAWKQSGEAVAYWKAHFSDEALSYRMSYVWKRTSKAMLATNLTTALAFASNVPSPILPMSAFGIIATYAVVHNVGASAAMETVAPCMPDWCGAATRPVFHGVAAAPAPHFLPVRPRSIRIQLILDIVAVPCIILIWETYLRHNRICCCVPRMSTSVRPRIGFVTRFFVSRAAAKPPSVTSTTQAEPTTADSPAEEQAASHKKTRVETFFAELVRRTTRLLLP